MGKRAQPADGTFFHVHGYESGYVAVPMDLISRAEARRDDGCVFCETTTGVFFKERGAAWTLAERIVVDKWVSSSTICSACLISDPIPVTYIGPRGREWTSTLTMLILAKDTEDLLFQVKLWKSGHRLLTTVRTKYGEVLVLSKRMPDGVDYVLRCPHCNKGIVLAVAPDRVEQ